MRRSVLLVLSVALAAMVFAPVAVAQGDDDMGADDRGVDARDADDRGLDDDATATPTSSASASATGSASVFASPSASASTSPSASASASPTASVSATAEAEHALPDTGGFPAALALAPLAMIVGGGLFALAIGRRR